MPAEIRGGFWTKEHGFDLIARLRWGRVLTIGLVLVILAATSIGWAVKEPMEWRETGDGTHTGYVTAVGKHGVLWRSWTAWFKTDAQSSQEDSYCVRLNDALAGELRQHADTRALVEITYKTYLAYDWGECNGEGAVIVGVRLLG